MFKFFYTHELYLPLLKKCASQEHPKQLIKSHDSPGFMSSAEQIQRVEQTASSLNKVERNDEAPSIKLYEHKKTSSGTSSLTKSSSNTRTGQHLPLFAHMFMLADRYDIKNLKSVTLTSFKIALNFCSEAAFL